MIKLKLNFKTLLYISLHVCTNLKASIACAIQTLLSHKHQHSCICPHVPCMALSVL